MARKRIKVAVLGASGYTGGELLRLLAEHPHATVTIVTADKSVGAPVSSRFPNLSSLCPLIFEPVDLESIVRRVDLVFMALPHTQSMNPVAQCLKAGKPVIDLSADYRLKSPKVYQTWYHVPHTAPSLLKEAVYGLPELHRTEIRKARLVAVPGCYPTAAVLQLAPLVAHRLIKLDTVVIDAKSGISGAGRSPALPYHFPEAHDSLTAYQIGEHRHTPEIEQELSLLAQRETKKGRRPPPLHKVVFTPHLAPMNRGILSTAYAQMVKPIPTTELRALYQKFYLGERFIRICEDSKAISPAYVRGSNFCDIGIFTVQRTRHVVTVAALDNLVKGAAGQAIQSMNLMMGFPEEAGLMAPGIFP